ncbi:hypothetical protein COOONC_03645 [Cooperia oncophora]
MSSIHHARANCTTAISRMPLTTSRVLFSETSICAVRMAVDMCPCNNYMVVALDDTYLPVFEKDWKATCQ